jgi:hypothetical protein
MPLGWVTLVGASDGHLIQVLLGYRILHSHIVYHSFTLRPSDIDAPQLCFAFSSLV